MSYSGEEMTETTRSLTPEEKLAQLQEENQRLQERIASLERLATKDELTDLDNHRTFNEELHRAVVNSVRTGQSLAVLFMDLDNFKTVNDTYGHLAGDTVLQKTAASIQQSVRENDRCSRYGGDEFAVILPATTKDHAIGVAERLRNRVEVLNITYKARQIPITASIGVGCFLPQNLGGQKPDQEIMTDILNHIVDEMDKTMYAASRAGKNKVGFLGESGRFVTLEPDPNKPNSRIAVSHELPTSI